MTVDISRLAQKVARYYLELVGDIYPQPQDEGHDQMAKDVIYGWVSQLNPCKTVLDVGCGEAFCEPYFEELGMSYSGVAIGSDVIEAKKQNRVVYAMDFSDLEFPDNQFHLVFSRHSLEHSPMPLITLMEWHRVATNWLCLVLPSPLHYGWAGRNHYSVLHPNQARFLLDRSGWEIIWEDDSEKTELRFMCQKKPSRYKVYPS